MAGIKAGPKVAADVDPATAHVEVGGYVCHSEPVTFDADRPVTSGGRSHAESLRGQSVSRRPINLRRASGASLLPSASSLASARVLS